MATGATIIESALRKLGVIASGEDPSSAEQSDCLESLNNLIDSLSNENMLIYDDNEETFSLVSGTSSYTMGSGGDFDTVRPLKILTARIKLNTSSPAIELPLPILNLDEWKQIVQKNVTSNIQNSLYIDYSYPLATLNFYPVPSAAQSVILNSKKVFASFATAGTSASLPPGYVRMLIYNLAIEVAPEYGIEPSGAIIKIANESKANIKRNNKQSIVVGNEVAALIQSKPYNWLTGV